MKVCQRPFNYLYLDNYEGRVCLCPWMKYDVGCIGNIVESDFEAIWHSSSAEKLRSEIKDGCFDSCRPEGCPHIQNNDLLDIADKTEFDRLTTTRESPEIVNLAFDFVCNQSCETCRDKVFTPPQYYKENVEKIVQKIVPVINKAKKITASGHGDPFASPYMMNVLSNIRPENGNFEVLLETNGVLFDEEHWERIKHLSDFKLDVVLTSNSFEKFTYEHISRGGNYDKLIRNLAFIKTLKEEGKIKKYTSSFVIQDRNFRELPSFIDRSLNEFGFDHVVLKPVYQWGTMPEKVFWFKDVLNPKHPYHAEYLEILKNPILHDKRVYNFGGDTKHPARDFWIEGENDPRIAAGILKKTSNVYAGTDERCGKKKLKECVKKLLGKK